MSIDHGNPARERAALAFWNLVGTVETVDLVLCPICDGDGRLARPRRRSTIPCTACNSRGCFVRDAVDLD